MTNELVKITEEFGLEKTQAQILLDNFSTFLTQANEWTIKANALVITDPSQIVEMQQAREARLALKNIRVEATKKHDELKERPLREGKAIDGALNIIKALIVPLEEHLEAQEKFIENIEKERKNKVNTERELELSKYVSDVSMYNYKEMSDEVFTNLLNSVKKIWDVEQEAIKQAELEKIETEKKEKERQKQIEIENTKLKQEAEAREKELTKERAEQEKKLEAERLKSKQEAEAREKLEKELQDKKDEEERIKKDAEIKKQGEELARIQAEKQAQLAPDKDKLLLYAKALEGITVPELQTQEAKQVLTNSLDYLAKAINLLKIK